LRPVPGSDNLTVKQEVAPGINPLFMSDTEQLMAESVAEPDVAMPPPDTGVFPKELNSGVKPEPIDLMGDDDVPDFEDHPRIKVSVFYSFHCEVSRFERR
jgi:hypothetical protein